MSIVLFVVLGLLWLVASGLLLMWFIGRKARTAAPLSREAMMWKSLDARRSQVRLSFWAIATGVFTVFAVGLNRPDFSHSEDDTSLTGGFSLWCENRIAIEYDLNNAEVRRKMHLGDLPAATHFMQCLVHAEDEASCLNLNKVSTPTVLGLKADDAKMFGLTLPEGDNILIDQESLVWSLMKNVGDTLRYDDKTVLVIAGTYPTGVFHGSALMGEEAFRKLWPEESGSRVMLVRTEQPDAVKDLLEIALNEYGITCTTTTERLEAFFTVTGTYLTIFLTLGGLGLMLGLCCMIIVTRKDLLSRRQQIETMSALGFSDAAIGRLMLREHLLVPLCAVTSGAVGSLISIGANFLSV